MKYRFNKSDLNNMISEFEALETSLKDSVDQIETKSSRSMWYWWGKTGRQFRKDVSAFRRSGDYYLANGTINGVKNKIFSIIVLMSTLLTACGITGKTDASDDLINTITKAAEEKDVDTLYNLYAPTIQASDTNLKVELQEFVDFYNGETVTSTINYSTEFDTTDEESGYKTKETDGYQIETTENTYEILIVYYPEAYDDDYLGVYSIGIQTEEDLNEEDGTMAGEIPGAYVITSENRDEIEERSSEALNP